MRSITVRLLKTLSTRAKFYSATTTYVISTRSDRDIGRCKNGPHCDEPTPQSCRQKDDQTYSTKYIQQ